ncbi:hypothetical protein GE115_08930 [Agromyces sp. CFH 90414]|uniref:Small multidrug efflux protein n=1 Tax=Agromyces agglutinans TaxID=2662258 RepID=A0A6I2FB85_9MICO|nr:hypothetical protein [Agromyces agglutinans]MRG59990.1 hypothetical protein [Agromyces agglutinans]
MIDALQDFTAGFPEWLQWLGVMIISAIPFVESELGSIVGVFIGLPTVVAVGAAVIGNVISMVIFVYTAHGVRSKAVASRDRRRALVGAGGAGGADADLGEASAAPIATAVSPRQEKVRRAFDRYGVAGVSLLGPFILPSQITSAAMVSFGANRKLVIIWQVIAITLWGTVFGVFATLGVSLAR